MSRSSARASSSAGALEAVPETSGGSNDIARQCIVVLSDDDEDVLQTPHADKALLTASEVCDNAAAGEVSARIANEVWPDFIQASAVESVGDALSLRRKEMEGMKEAGYHQCRWRDLGISIVVPKLECMLLKMMSKFAHHGVQLTDAIWNHVGVDDGQSLTPFSRVPRRDA